MYNIKNIPLGNVASKVSNGIFFVLYNLYYVGQIDDLGTDAGSTHPTGGSNRCLSERS